MLSNNIIWLGVGELNPSTHCKSYDSPAAIFWQRELIHSFNRNKLGIISLSHLVFPRWPKGPLKIQGGLSRSSKNNENIYYSNVEYINFPIQKLKNNQLITGYINQLKQAINQHGIPKLIIAYNGFPFTFAVAEYAKKKWGLKTIIIIADQPPRGFFKSVEQFENLLSSLDGCIFLSWHYYNQMKSAVTAFHFEGGVSNGDVDQEINSIIPRVHGKRIIMFCGSYGKHAGLDSLLAAARLLRSSDVEIWIAGGLSQSNQRIGEVPDNVVNLGYLTQSELDRRMKIADIFVSPNSTSYSPNNNNFPSKILLYLKYAKPIICTWTEGLSPDYRDVLSVVERDTPTAIANKIEEVLAWDSIKYLERCAQMRKFANSRSWIKQSELLMKWCFERTLKS